MCYKVNPRRLLPKTATDGQIVVYNATTGYWEAADNTGGGAFDPTADAAISGNWSFNKPINIKLFGGSPTTPSEGHSIYSTGLGNETRLFSNGLRSIYDYSAITATRTITVPDASGTMAITSDLSGYLPLTGGTLTGALQTSFAIAAGVTASGHTLINSSAAALGAQRYSPATIWTGNGWETTGGTSQSVSFRAYVIPVQGTTSSGYLNFGYSMNGASYSTVFQIDPTRVSGTGLGKGLTIGSYDANYGGLWSTNVTRSSSNFAFISNGNLTEFNGGTDLYFDINAIGQMHLNATGLKIGAITNPTARLEVQGAAGVDIMRLYQSDGTTNAFKVDSIGQVSARGYLAFGGDYDGTGGNGARLDISSGNAYFNSYGQIFLRTHAGTGGGGLAVALTLDNSQNATFAGTITTAAPTGGAAAWKLGKKTTVTDGALTALGIDSQIEVDIAGNTFYIPAKATTPFA